MKFTSRLLLIFSLLLLSSCGTSTKVPPEAPCEPKQIVTNKNRIVMGWNAFGTTDTYIEQNSISPSLNVVSPSWLRLNAELYVTSEVDKQYIKWAHQSGKFIWPLFGNKFDPELTHYILGDINKRNKLVHLLRDILVNNDLDGINVDFENIDIQDKQNYVAFIRELKNTLQPYGITVSVDVSRENPDPSWSGSFDRHELGKAADYMIMMGYDEDLSGGGKMGSVASIPWVEQGLQLLLKDVPARKTILAIPFYTRDWVTNLETQELYKQDLSMAEANKIVQEKGLKKKWDPQAKQNYVEYTENGEKHQIWIEDDKSINQRLNLVERYKLRGVSAWYMGQESPEIWHVFSSK